MLTFLRTMLLAAVCTAVCSAFAAAAAPKVTLHLTGALVTVSNGKTTYAPVDHAVKAGDLLRYTIVAKNVGSAPAYALAPIGRIPGRTAFVRVIGAPPSVGLYSLNGRTWSAHPTIAVKEPDGKTVTKPAPLDLYRAIRWTLLHPLVPKASDTFVYEVRVK